MTGSILALPLAALVIAGLSGSVSQPPPTTPPAKPAQATRPPAAPAPAAPAPAAQTAAFPAAFVGSWRGDCTLAVPAGKGMDFVMGLEIGELKKNPAGEERAVWTIVYDGKQGKQERPYELVVRDAAKGLYAIDEKQGIVLECSLIDSTLYGHFSVEGVEITSVEKFLGAGTPDERIEIELITVRKDAIKVTGGKDGIPDISTGAAASVQKATLRRVKAENATKHEPAGGPTPNDAPR